MRQEPEHRQHLLDNMAFYREGLRELGVDFWNSPSPGLPIVIGDKEKCHRVWSLLCEQGFFTLMVWSPAVAAGKELLRTSVTAPHTQEHIGLFLAALSTALKKVGHTSSI